jgi:hypothetical protein
VQDRFDKLNVSGMGEPGNLAFIFAHPEPVEGILNLKIVSTSST